MKAKLIKGAFVVTLASLFVKVLSIVYKIPYQNITGDKGFYIYQQMYPIFALMGAMGSYAFPLAISESLVLNKDKQKETINSVFFFFWMISGLFSLIFLFINIGQLMGDENLKTLFYPLIPLLVLVPIVSILRAFLYSNEDNVHKVAYSISLEQLFRVLFIVFILILYMNKYLSNLYDVASYSLLGFSVGLVMGILIIIRSFDFTLVNFRFINIKAGITLFKRGMFLLLSASLLLLMQLIDSFTIINELSNLVNEEKAMVIKGVYDRGLPIIQTAVFFVPPILSSFMPHIVSKENYRKLLTLIIFLSLPSTIGLMMVMEDLNIFLFKDNQYTSVLQINAVVVFLYSLILTLSANTKNNKLMTSVILLGLLIKWMGNIIFINHISILGASLSTIVSLTMILIILIIINYQEIKLSPIIIGKIILANTVMLLVLSLIQNIDLFGKILLGSGIYFITAYSVKIKKSDLLISK